MMSLYMIANMNLTQLTLLCIRGQEVSDSNFPKKKKSLYMIVFYKFVKIIIKENSRD